ncbi:hypothetical protein VaNZ11_006088 [Volvox africanus]|uniref:Uncharacterized protein n=1 Tax=Volvox africanus TaxID=51714 RepID=A0ABQ5RZY4_9CHLO|nr:hypothetical protein VaNZ11_006088 [Volvox africanus]
MSSSIGNGNSSVVPQDMSIARPRVPYPVCPSFEQSSCAQQCLMITSADKVSDLKPCDSEIKEVLKGAAGVQACTSVTNMTPPSAKIDRPAPHARFAEFFERSAKLKDYIFESQLFCARAAWRAQEFLMQGMEPEVRTTCEGVAHVRQMVAELETEAAVRREDKLQVEMDEAKKQLLSFAAAEQQFKLQLADSTEQIDDLRVQLQRMQAEKEEQIAAVRRDAAASGAELEALREQLRLAQQQMAQQEQYAAAAAATATTTAATAGTTIAPSTGDVDMELVPAPSPILTSPPAPASFHVRSRLVETENGSAGCRRRDDAHAASAPRTQVLKVVVLQRMKSFTMELAMKRDTYMGQEVLAAATLFLQPALSTASEELHLLHCPNGVGSAPYLPLDAKATLDDAFFAQPGVEADEPRVVLVRTPRHTGLARPAASREPVYKQRDLHGLPAPTWAVIHLVKLLSPVQAQANLYFQPIRRLAVLPLMVPLDVGHVEGGREAEAAVTQHLVNEMEHLSAECMEPVFMLRPLQYPDPSYLFVSPHEQATAHFGCGGPSTLLSSDDGALPLLTAVLPQETPDDMFEMGALPAAKGLTRVMQTDACMQRKHRTQRTQQQQPCRQQQPCQQQQQSACRHKWGREQAEAEANEEEHQHQQRSRRTRLANAPCGTPRAAFVGGDLKRMLATVLTGGLKAVAMVMGNLL